MLFVFFFQHNPLNSLATTTGLGHGILSGSSIRKSKVFKVISIETYLCVNEFFWLFVYILFVLNRTRTISSVMIIGSWNKSYLLLKVIYKKNIAINIAAFRQASQTAKDGPPRKKTYIGKLKKLASFRKRDLVLTS